MTYAIISLGGKQYRVREGERLRVERLAVAEGKTFHPADPQPIFTDNEPQRHRDTETFSYVVSGPPPPKAPARLAEARFARDGGSRTRDGPCGIGDVGSQGEQSSAKVVVQSQCVWFSHPLSR